MKQIILNIPSNMWRSNPTTTDCSEHTDVICCRSSVSQFKGSKECITLSYCNRFILWPLGRESSRSLYRYCIRRPCDLLHVMSTIPSNTIYYHLTANICLHWTICTCVVISLTIVHHLLCI